MSDLIILVRSPKYAVTYELHVYPGVSAHIRRMGLEVLRIYRTQKKGRLEWTV